MSYLFTDASGMLPATAAPPSTRVLPTTLSRWGTNALVCMGSFAAFGGWAVLTTRVFPRWAGWLMVASGVGLALTRFDWPTIAWLPPYSLIWIWVIAVCIRLLRNPA